MAAAPYLLRLPIRHPDADQKSHVLVSITPASDDSSLSQSLDLELVATDGLTAYVLTLQHSRLSKYRDSKGPCSEPEWEDCLRALLLDDQPIGDVEAIARTTGEGYLFIEVRKRVSGHTQKFGELKLRRSKTAEDSIDIFDWCAEAVRLRSQLEKELTELRRKHDDLQKLVAEETARFGELERSKHEFENEHDSWLKDLLNEKKVKIRMQEQILATAHVDETKLAAVAVSKRRAAAGVSGKGKRKAEVEDSDIHGWDTDDEADKMDLDVGPDPGSHEEMSDAGMTTQDSEMASDPEPEPAPKPEPKKLGRKGARASLAFAATSSRKAGQAKGEGAGFDVNVDSEDDSPPPKPLPASKKKPAPVHDPADDESTASASD